MINTLKKTPSSRKPLSTYSFLGGGRGKGCVLVVGAYLSLSERGTGWALNSRLGAYELFLPLRWALIRGKR